MQRKEHGLDELDVLILGPVPPPFGGVAAHLSRVVPLLRNAGFEVGVLNHFSSNEGDAVVGVLNKNPLNYYLLPKRFRPRIVHYHHSRWAHLVATALGRGSSNARYIVTLHGGDIQDHSPLASKNPVISRITRWALGRFETVIVVDPRIASAVEGHLENQRIEVLPAFLEATRDEHAKYEPAIEAFLGTGRVLVTAAYDVQFLNGREIYGLDTAIEAFVSLAPDREDLRLAIFVACRPSRGKARRHLAALERRLDKAGLTDRALIVFGLPLLPALRQNVIFVRPTRAEGDAVSIREAQAAGVPVVASNVVRRPPGVVLFETEDVACLCDAVRAVLGNSAPPRKPSSDQAEAPPANQFAEALIQLYRRELMAQVPPDQ